MEKCDYMEQKEHKNPCICDTCLRARDEEVRRVRTGLLAEVENLITAEMLVCYKENTPTSRLTSLSNKLETLREKYDNSRTNY